MHAFFTAVGRFSVRFRWAVIVFWIAATVGAAISFPSLTSVAKSNNSDFLPKNAPSVRAADLAAPLANVNLTTVPVVVARTSGTPDPGDAAAVVGLSAAMRRVPHVVAVRDLGRSPDGTATQLVVFADVPRGGDQAAISLVTDLRGAIRTTTLPSGVQAHTAGELAVSVDNAQHSARNSTLTLVSSVLILLLLLGVFRALLAPLLTLLPAVLASQLAGPLVGEASTAGLKVSQLSVFMLSILVIGAGTDYGLFLVFRVREQARQGAAPRDAVIAAMGRVGESITFSAATVIAALLSLLLATFGVYQSLGPPLAIGIAVMLAVGLTLTPALLAVFGRAAFWPSSLAPGTRKVGLWGRLASGIVARPVATLVIGVVAFGALALASLGNRPAGFGQQSTAPAGTDSAAGNALLTAKFPRASANPTDVLVHLASSAWQSPQVLVTLRGALQASPQFASVNGPLNPNGIELAPGTLAALHASYGDPRQAPLAPPSGVAPRTWAAYRADANNVSADGRTVQYLVSLTAGDPSTTSALNAVPAIQAAVTHAATTVGATAWGVAGEAPAIYDISATSTADLLRIVPVAIVVIGLLLALVMRSLVAPLYLIASVALSYLAALGFSVVIFIWVLGDGGLTFFLPFLMFLFLLALGEDYNILVMSRVREEAHHLPLRAAVRRALEATGTTVTSAGLVLAGVFGIFAVLTGGSNAQLRDIGFGLCVGILMDSFLVRTLLVPSTVVLLGRWNWWPSRLFRDAPQDEPAVLTSTPVGS